MGSTRTYIDQNQRGEVKEAHVVAEELDDVVKCFVKNMIEAWIKDFVASFHVTNCIDVLYRFRIRSGKVRLANEKTLDISGFRDVVLKTSLGTSWTLKDVSWDVIGGTSLWWDTRGGTTKVAHQRSKEDDVMKISTTMFVTNFPDESIAKELFRACSVYGHVVDSYIPNKRAKT
nr:putative retrovirus-related Pol polyprotein from transposon TNT 1-94 [Tanacetum cinerariifolium]